MLQEMIFGFTGIIVILNLFKIIGVIFGNSLSFPRLNDHISPTGWMFAYPSMLYQAFYWAPALMINPPL